MEDRIFSKEDLLDLCSLCSQKNSCPIQRIKSHTNVMVRDANDLYYVNPVNAGDDVNKKLKDRGYFIQNKKMFSPFEDQASFYLYLLQEEHNEIGAEMLVITDHISQILTGLPILPDEITIREETSD